MPEVSNEDLALLNLSKKVLGSKNKTQFQRMVKEVDPSLQIHDLDVEDRITAATSEQEKKIAALQAEIDRRSALDGLKEKRSTIKTKFNLDDKGVEAVEKLMVERGIASHETAAEFFALNSRPASPMPTTARSTKIEVPMAEAMAKDPSGWARDEAAKVLNELHGAK